MIDETGRLGHVLLILLGFLLTMGCSGEDGKHSQDKHDLQKGRQIAYTDTVHFVRTSGDTVVSIAVAVADDENERSMGLMDVNDLPLDKGMLFIFPEEQPRSFWMANTPLPLDIIFVNENREIVRIHRDAKPFSEDNFPSGKPARYVVETNAGFCVSHDIQEGMGIAY